MKYFDYCATTPVDRRVAELMSDVNEHVFGNPSSVHRYGQKARSYVERSRRQIAAAIGCKPSEIIFTGSGSEANNLVLRNLLYGEKKHVVLSAIEHPSIYSTIRELEPLGMTCTIVDVDKTGRVSPPDIAAAILDNTALVTVMMANNEVGTLQPIAEIACLCQEHNIPFHSDGVQALGKIPIQVQSLGITTMSFSAHKLYGPKGVGALYATEGYQLHPLISGGSQENSRRAGTENVLGITGFGLAVELAGGDLNSEMERLHGLRKGFLSSIRKTCPEVVVNGHPTETLPGVVSLSFPDVSAEKLIMKLDRDGFAVSAGAACASGSPQPSRVLQALGLSDELNQRTIRISFGRLTTLEEVTALAGAISRHVSPTLKEVAV